MLLKSQRNQLYQELLDKGLQATDFSESTGERWYKIRCNPNHDFQFEIRDSPSRKIGSYEIVKKPGGLSNPHHLFAYNANSWNELIGLFNSWSLAVKDELDLPDLWLEATKAIQLFESAADPAASGFTIAELGALHGQLRTLTQLFENSELLREHQTELAALTQTATVKADIFTKKDWQNWVKGAFVSVIVSLELSEIQAQELLALVRLAFGGLFLKQ